jgi:hypothetical protein
MGMSAIGWNDTVSGSFWQETDALASLNGFHGTRDFLAEYAYMRGFSRPKRTFHEYSGV